MTFRERLGIKVSSENIKVDSWSDMTDSEAKSLIGKTISKVVAKEFGVKLIFTDGSGLRVDRGFETLRVEFNKDSESLD